jgi:ketosteroid isomerase-like protein
VVALEVAQMDLMEVLEQFQQAANEFARGNPEPVKALWSRSEDVTLANPFGSAMRGWEQVSKALEYASSRFRDGAVTDFRRVSEYASPDLVSILEIEKWQAKVAGREEVTPFELRVSSTFRREEDGWKLVHRHADPLTDARPDGPLQGSPG